MLPGGVEVSFAIENETVSRQLVLPRIISSHFLFLQSSNFFPPSFVFVHNTLGILCKESFKRSRDLETSLARSTSPGDFSKLRRTISSSSPSLFRYVQRNGLFISKAPTMLLLRLQVSAAMERWSQEMAMWKVRSCQPLGRGKSIYILNILYAI